MRRGKIAALLCAVLTVCSLQTMPAVAEAKDTQTDDVIQIFAPEDLIAFAQSCHDDSWSKGKTVLLENDLDLRGTEFTCIPIFNGTFDGNGHRITGYTYGGDGYVNGFFRYVGSAGVVQELMLYGNVIAGGEQECTGGIAGINQGKIVNCAYYGHLSGNSETGGIVGINQPGGTIEICTNYARVTGYYYTGGIVGKNYGQLTNCSNSGMINDNAAWVEEDDEKSSDLLNELAGDDGLTSIQSGIDTGGIAGYSVGLLRSCKNYGTVGYEHVGYNIGGVAGRQSGVVWNCSNYGNVYGKKDVGGIVGQQEPYIETNQGTSIRNSVERLHDKINRMVADADGASDTMLKDARELQKHSDTALKAAGELSKHFEDFVNTNTDAVNEGIERMESPNLDTDKARQELEGRLQEAGDTEKTAEEIKSETRTSLTGVSEGWDQNMNSMLDELNAMSKVLSGLNSDAENYSDTLHSDITAVSDQMDTIYNLIADLVTGVEESGLEYLFTDISEDALTYAPSGKIQDSTNSGIVRGDINVGGIVGCMSVDEENLENNVVVTFQLTTGERYTLASIVQGSTNRGYVTVRNDCAGGIVGDMEQGIVYRCYGYGSAESTDGNYVGGVAGKSMSTISDSYALSSLAGQKNIGGIAGYGTKIKGCVSMPIVSSYTGKCGAVAGQVSLDENTKEMDTVNIRDNVFVSDALYGIDDISYEGSAEQSTYEQLLKMDGIPPAFSQLTVSFRVEDTVLDSVRYDYGTPFSEVEFPKLPKRAGYYGEWEDTTGRVVNGNLVIQAAYVKKLTVLESAARYGDTGKALCYVEGAFEAKDVLEASMEERPFEPSEKGSFEEYVIYSVQVSDQGAQPDDYRLRVYNPYKTYSVWELRDDTWTQIQASEKGSYLQLAMKETAGVYCIAEPHGVLHRNIILAAGVATVVAVLLVIVHSVRRRKKSVA